MAKVRVAYFGRPGSYSHLAAVKRFGKHASYLSCPTHPRVVEALLNRKATIGVLPIENSVAGVVMDTIDTLVSPEFVRSKIAIREYLELAPQLCLLSNQPLKNIRRLYSHPFPLRYLSRWIQKYLPGVDLFETVSTSEAAQLASERTDTAAIAGPQAADIYKLRILKDDLANVREYLTRFCVISAVKTSKAVTPTHSAYCFGLKHKPGSLVSALSVLSRHRLNLTRIISRPLSQRTGKFEPDAFLFWVDVDHQKLNPKERKDALKEMKHATTFFDVLGDYTILPRLRE
jgi:chorismate mutase / prephenate dehydratase